MIQFKKIFNTFVCSLTYIIGAGHHNQILIIADISDTN